MDESKYETMAMDVIQILDIGTVEAILQGAGYSEEEIEEFINECL